MNRLLEWFIGGLTNWKTTLSAIVGLAAVLLGQLGIVVITPDQQITIVAFFMLVIGWFAKDSNVAGKPLEEKGEVVKV